MTEFELAMTLGTDCIFDAAITIVDFINKHFGSAKITVSIKELEPGIHLAHAIIIIEN